RIKSRVSPMLGFKSFSNARRVLAGVELAHKIIKGQFGLPDSFGTDPFHGPTLNLNPDRSISGARIVARGSGWGVCPVALYIGEDAISPARVLLGFPQPGLVKPDAHGRFVITLVVPEHLQPGEHRVEAVAGRRSELRAEALLHVLKRGMPTREGDEDDPWGRS